MTAAQPSRLIVDHVRHWARTQGDAPACTFLADGQTVTGVWSYAELNARADALAAELRANAAVGVPVLILCPAGLDYVASLLGCFYAGAIAVPAYPPTRTGIARTLPRIRAICADCAPGVVLTTAAVREVVAAEPELLAAMASALVLEVDRLMPVAGRDPAPDPAADAPALLQYTSGSTSAPKGVLITQAQLASNLTLIGASGLSCSDVLLSWLPPYHDMGLIGGILAPLYLGGQSVLMPPDVFLRRPRRWLEAVATFKATALVTPNFALDACVRRISAEQRTGLDLSSVRMVYIGAEPVRAETLTRFAEAFRVCGLRHEALYPCYGMAEATLIISGGARGALPIVHERFVSCGRALLGSRILITHPETSELLRDGEVGEIWVQSPSIATGYWRNPEATAQTFAAHTRSGDGPFLRTGDLGFMDRGELFISGRLKDLIIVRGRNHYPQDIEQTVQALDDALVVDSGAAFAVTRDGEDASEQLVFVQEIDKRAGVDVSELLLRIPDAIREAHDITPSAVVLIKRGSLPKTSSGKVQRSATRKAFLDGALQVAAQWRAPSAAVSTRSETEADPSRTARQAIVRTQPPAAARSQREIEDWLRARIAEKLGVETATIDLDEPVARYGVDSALAAEIIEDLQQWIELRLDTTISYDHPTIAGLARAVAAMGVAASKVRTLPSHSRASSSTRLARAATGREVAAADPIAIVGMACRFPGARDLKSFWELLLAGRDAVTEVPIERWDANALYDETPGAAGKMCSRWGGFVERIEDFDATFFGISAHEAARMDPQQRMFLEVAWEALEDAGLAPSALAGTRSAVYAGVCTSDFATLYGGDLRLIDAEYGTGSSSSLVANRLSYLLDLRGPSEAVDSACSSALVALDHASKSLANHDCDLAIVGGVNAVLAPEVGVSLSQLGALAKDGRCKAFDHRADGFVRSEGAGVVVLKRLSNALAAGDHVYALVSACAVNHDGRSNGLTAPSGPAQREVVSRALELAEISADAIDYVEAHGVGAPIADAVELKSLGAVMATGSRESPLRVGSAKTNVGHLEAASGMVGVIKVALSLTHELLPRQIHFERAAAGLGLEELPIAITTEATAWPRSARPRFAGVSAFGFGGSNAHVILREAPAPRPAASSVAQPSSPHLVTLSARTPSALATSVRNLADAIEPRTDTLGDLAYTLNVGRSCFAERLAIVASNVDELRERLLSVAIGGHDAHVFRGSNRPSTRLSLSLAFTDGSVDAAALRALSEAHPILQRAFDLSERVLQGQLALPLRQVLEDPNADTLLARPSFAHAALISVQHALCSLLRALAIEPSVIYGRGVGEYAAAAATGALPWDKAILLATRRGLLLEGMSEDAQQRVTLRDLKRELAALDTAFLAPRVPLISALLGRAFGHDEVPDSAHWSRHLLSSPQLGLEGQEALLAESPSMHLELGPRSALQLHPSLTPSTWLVALDGTAPAFSSLLRAIATLYARGARVEWEAFYAPLAPRKLSLPTYPFERERHWLDFPARDASGERKDRITERPVSHPLISRMRISQPAIQSGFVRKAPSDEDERVIDELGRDRK